MEIEFSAAVDSVKVKVKNIDGFIVRSCEMKFSCEFDAAIARAISPEALVALNALRDHGMEQVVLPLDAVNVSGTLLGGSGVPVEIPQMLGMKATCKEGDAESGEPPQIDLVFSCLWSEAVWMFLGRHAGARVQMTTVDRQLSMELPVPAEAQARS
jgi:hypothetical protein